jgi:glutamate-1-semialdehyde 2,1-aminomutase
MAPLGDVYQAGTLSANPVSMSAGLTALNKLIKTDPYAALAQNTRQLADELMVVAGRSTDIPLRVQYAGSLFWIVLGQIRSADGVVRTPAGIPVGHKERYGKLFHALLDAGFYLPPSAFEVGFLSAAHTELHRRSLVEAFGNALFELAH